MNEVLPEALVSAMLAYRVAYRKNPVLFQNGELIRCRAMYEMELEKWLKGDKE